MGYGVRISRTVNATAATAATPNAVSTCVLVQPWCGASMIAHTSDTSATADSAAPNQSTGCGTGLRDVGTMKWPTMIATITTGTFTRKIAPHQKCSSRKPPATGPAATATPAMPAHMPIASARSRASVKVLVRIDSVAGMISAAPMPITARAPMSASTLPANAAAADAVPNTTRPTASAPFRPYRSPIVPAVSSKPANTREYASTTHWRSLMLEPSSRTSVGSATLTIVLSTTITNRLTQSTPSTHQRRGSSSVARTASMGARDPSRAVVGAVGVALIRASLEGEGLASGGTLVMTLLLITKLSGRVNPTARHEGNCGGGGTTCRRAGRRDHRGSEPDPLGRGPGRAHRPAHRRRGRLMDHGHLH